jgi:hypothetical protein
MNALIVSMIVMIAGNICFLFVPFSTNRTRAKWAKLLFVITGILGITVGAIHLALDTGWLTFSAHTIRGIYIVLHNLGGVWMGFLISLFISGQVDGTKITGNKMSFTDN